MEVEKFLSILGGDFYTGVPDSLLKSLINYLMKTYGIDSKHHVMCIFHATKNLNKALKAT